MQKGPYKKIKLPDGTTIDEHRLVWIQAYGDIPAGMCVHHKNGDKRDNRLENLELKSRSAHATHHLTGTPRPWQRDPPIKHGGIGGYERGCKCELCKAANRERVARGRLARGGR